MTEGATHLACDEVLVVHNSQDESIELPALRNPDSNKSNQQVSWNRCIQNINTTPLARSTCYFIVC